MDKDYDRVGIVGHQTARPVLDPRKSARPNNNLPKVGTGKHMNRVMVEQLTLEELRAQFEEEYSFDDLHKDSQSWVYLCKSTRISWSAYRACAKANNILREG